MINEKKRKVQEEALEALRKNDFCGMVILPTGTGKTWVLIEALKEIYEEGMSVLYACNSIRLRDEEFNNELRKWNGDAYSEKIQKECYATTYKYSGNYWDVLLADEADYALTPEYSKLFLNNKFKHIILVSATLDSKKVKLARSIAPIVYKKNVKEVEENKIVNKAKFIILPYILNDKENKRYLAYNKRFGTLMYLPPDKNRDDRLRALSFDRMHFMSNLDSSIVIVKRAIDDMLRSNKNRKFLIFCASNKQADKFGYSYHTANEDIDSLNRFNRGDINTLAVCGKIDRGVNLDGVNVIILESFTRSETKMIQRVGRGKRLDVDEILYVIIPLPYFKRGKRTEPTIAKRWIEAAGKNIGIENAIYHYLK